MTRIITLCFFAGLIHSGLWAQSCDIYHPLVKDFSFEIQHYGKNKKVMGNALHIVQSVEPTSAGSKAVVEMVMTTPKGKSGAPIRYTVECNGGAVKIDTRSALSGPPDPAFKDEGSCFTDLSSTLGVGQAFPDCQFSSTGKNSYSEIKIYNRKVVAKETVTVTAGTFDAYLIEYEMTTVIKSPGIKLTLNKHHKDWYAPGKGFVKTESFKPNSKYTPGDEALFSSELVAIKSN